MDIPASGRADHVARSARISASWREDRAYLLAAARRILADADGAEDVVAEAYARLSAQVEAVRDARGWLVVVVRRIALDRLRSAHRRLTTPVDPAESALDLAPASAASSDDPADRISLDDENRRALAAVLDWLTPGERAAFLVHDVFGLPFDDIGTLLGRTPGACRQLASRARRSIRDSPSGVTAAAPPPDPQLDLLVERFVAACAGGDVGGLAALLHEDVSGWAVRGGAVLGEARGAGRVSARAASLFGRRSPWSMVPFPLEDGAGVLVTRSGSPAGMIRLIVDAGVIEGLQATLLDDWSAGPVGRLD
ncbi:sigma-70 family RNA polymerase sigma factor [Nesterenkonia halobia]|uniref:Uncharacterized protein n=1 Tax=Nesterenkonia halobia TaxID=37922 RepID=A0ABP6RC40_9MICC